MVVVVVVVVVVAMVVVVVVVVVMKNGFDFEVRMRAFTRYTTRNFSREKNHHRLESNWRPQG